jgi:hypothetical protein
MCKNQEKFAMVLFIFFTFCILICSKSYVPNLFCIVCFSIDFITLMCEMLHRLNSNETKRKTGHKLIYFYQSEQEHSPGWKKHKPVTSIKELHDFSNYIVLRSFNGTKYII